VSMQNHYNLVYREEEREMLPLCRAEGIAVTPWSPLARGFFAGNRRRGRKDATLREAHDEHGHGMYYADTDYDIADRVGEVAKERGVLPIQLGLAWLLNQPGITSPIIGVTKVEQLDDLILALDIQLSAEERRQLEDPYRPHPIVGHS
jgi:1-deoxyxylulose-5-phosphate synthase